MSNVTQTVAEVARRNALTIEERVAEDEAGYVAVGATPNTEPLTRDQVASKIQAAQAATKLVSDAAAEAAVR